MNEDFRPDNSVERTLTSEERINHATTFDELHEIISGLAEIKGESGTYSPADVIKRIEQVRHGHRDIGFVTRAFGLRDKVESMLPDDKVFKKYSKKF